jgi:hypothetical protein
MKDDWASKKQPIGGKMLCKSPKGVKNMEN